MKGSEKMARSKFSLRVLGLCAFVLSLMAFATSGVAQAEPGAQWGYINDNEKPEPKLKFFDSKLEGQLQIKEIENKTASLLFTTGGGTKVTILCTGASFDEGGQLAAEGAILLGRLHFTGCKTLLNGTLSPPCEPHTGASKGLILSLKFTGLIILHKLVKDGKLDPVVLLIPDQKNAKGEPSGAVIELGEECSIGESVEVTGHLDVWDCKNLLTTHMLEHLVEEFPELRLLRALGQPATIDGTAFVKLIGEHEGFLWAGLPA
jgi:hypothetical protein